MPRTRFFAVHETGEYPAGLANAWGPDGARVGMSEKNALERVWRRIRELGAIGVKVPDIPETFSVKAMKAAGWSANPLMAWGVCVDGQLIGSGASRAQAIENASPNLQHSDIRSLKRWGRVEGRRAVGKLDAGIARDRAEGWRRIPCKVEARGPATVRIVPR